MFVVKKSTVDRVKLVAGGTAEFGGNMYSSTVCKYKSHTAGSHIIV